MFLAFERYMSIRHPLFVQSCRTLRWQIIITTFIILTSLATSIPTIFQVDLHQENTYSNRTDCFFNSFSQASSLLIIEMLIENIFPFTLVLIFNSLMIRSLYNVRNRIISQKLSIKHNQARDVKFSLSTLFFNFIYIGMKLPLGVYHLIMAINIFQKRQMLTHYDNEMRIVVNLYCSTCSLTFFVYFTFYKIFRNEFMLMVRYK